MAIRGKAADGTANTAGAKATFNSKCAMCHGPNGAGSDVGKSMHVPDLRSSAIQKKTESELAGVIANGNNAMPSFKGSLNAGQIRGLVAYIRTFAAKK
jgi:mono/diheme cytochrome c family protein